MALDPNRWTLKTREAFEQATRLAADMNNSEITPEHLLLELLGQQDGIVVPILDRLGLAPLSVRNRLEDALSKLPKAYGASQAQASRELTRVLNDADAAQHQL